MKFRQRFDRLIHHDDAQRESEEIAGVLAAIEHDHVHEHQRDAHATHEFT